MNKQTAVEWLEYMFIHGEHYSIEAVMEWLKHAKQMEKEQLEEAWNDGNLLGRNGHVILEYTTGKEYYKETYK